MPDDERSRDQKKIEQQERKTCAELRAGVLEGYQDILAGRVYEFEGNLQALLDEARKRGNLKKRTVLEGPILNGVDLDRDRSPMRDADL